MIRRFLPVLFLAVFCATAFRSSAAPLANNQTIKLASGRVAKILSISKVEYSKGVMALMVRYQTSLSLDERKAISQEVDDVWKFAQKEVERANLREAIITTNETPHGMFITASRVETFLYEKGADDKWKRLSRADLALQ